MLYNPPRLLGELAIMCDPVDDEELQEPEDLKALRAAKAEQSDAPTVCLSDAKQELGF
jgi:hypothetical protein